MEKRGRDLRLDFFRGLALVFIFIDHIPINIIANITIRNFGLSDATEVFLFLSGYSAALAYAPACRDKGVAYALARIWRRVWVLYVTHIFLFVIFLAEISVLAARLQDPLFIEEAGVMAFLSQPGTVLVQALLLKFKPALMDPLPLYIVLLLVFPAILWLLERNAAAVAGLSAVVYLAARILDWNLPAYPQGHWFFNPLAWQFLFLLGALCGHRTANGLPMVRSRGLLAVAGGYLILSFILVLSWRWPALHTLWPQDVMRWLYPIDKTGMHPLRLLHFLALAYVVTCFLRADNRLFVSRAVSWLIMCGRHSLPVFCFGIVLSFFGHFFLTAVTGGVIAQIGVNIGGIAAMAGLAWFLTWYKMIESGARAGARRVGCPGE